MQIKFLGTANASGIPVFNCNCEICTQYKVENRFNHSTCAYIELNNNEIILIDAGRDDLSSLFYGKRIKAVFITHFHADHVIGLLKLRYGVDKITCFHPKDEKEFADLFRHKLAIDYIENTPFEPIIIDDISFTPIPLKHSKITTGYLIESKNKTIAYLTDCGGLDESSLNFLLNKDIDECYIDATHTPDNQDKNHLNYEKATKILDEINAKKSFFIHGSHETLNYIKNNNIQLKYSYL